MTTPEPTNGADEVSNGETESTVGLVSARVRPHAVDKVRVRRQREGVVTLAAVSVDGGAVTTHLVLDQDSALELARDLERVARGDGEL